MFSVNFLSKWSFSKSVVVFFTVVSISAYSQAKTEQAEPAISHEAATKASLPILEVYKSPTCGCCKKWIDHIDNNGFQSIVHNRVDLSSIKKKQGIAPRYRSCHTAVSEEGYSFEGHVPAKFIKQFLAEKPKDALGLAVPAMPVGTPGMEVGDKFQPYRVLLLKTDGSYETYSMVNSYKEQF